MIQLPAGRRAELNVDGRARAVNILTPFRTWRGRVRRWYIYPFGVFIGFDWVGFRYPERFYPFRGMGVIHFLTFAMLRRFPYLGASQPRENVKHSFLLFCSAYNGDAHQYLDLFSDGIDPGEIMSLWGDTPHDIPSRPVTPWKDHVFEHVFETQHFYSAYDTASTADVRAALAAHKALRSVQRREGQLRLRGSALTDALEALVREHQGSLGHVGRDPATEADEPPERVEQAADRRRQRGAPLITPRSLAEPPRRRFRLGRSLRGGARMAGIAAGVGLLAVLRVAAAPVMAVQALRPGTRHPHHGLVFLCPVLEGHTAALEATLRAMGENSPFARSPLTHVGRLAMLHRQALARGIDIDEQLQLQSDYLLVHLVADARPMTPWELLRTTVLRQRNAWFYLDQLAGAEQAGPALADVLGHCVAFPARPTAQQLRGYLWRCRVRASYTYRDAHATVQEVRSALGVLGVLREFARKLQALQGGPHVHGQVRALYEGMLSERALRARDEAAVPAEEGAP
jgi:hypothetical protein